MWSPLADHFVTNLDKCVVLRRVYFILHSLFAQFVQLINRQTWDNMFLWPGCNIRCKVIFFVFRNQICPYFQWLNAVLDKSWGDETRPKLLSKTAKLLSKRANIFVAKGHDFIPKRPKLFVKKLPAFVCTSWNTVPPLACPECDRWNQSIGWEKVVNEVGGTVTSP